MLKEYLNRKIDENEEKIKGLKCDIIQIQHRIEENENIVAVLKKETSSNAEIFSPRSHRIQNKEKLEQILNEIEKSREDLDNKNKLLEDCLQKQKEYGEMLTEAQKSVENNEDNRHIMPQIHSVELSEAEDRNVSRETFSINQSEIERERALVGTRIAEGLRQFQSKQTINEKMVEKEEPEKTIQYQDGQLINDDLNMEIKSGELIILESERKKEKEFLKEVYLKIERSLALLNGNKNVCKKELQQVKKMIYEYVQSIT